MYCNIVVIEFVKLLVNRFVERYTKYFVINKADLIVGLHTNSIKKTVHLEFSVQ